MSLKAKQRILKLRETEYKLQKLQSDLQKNVSAAKVNSNDDKNNNNVSKKNSPTSMSDFLAHHKELMALPGSNRDSVPYRFSFEAPNRYMEPKQSQKLTLPPKIPAVTISPLRAYKETFDFEDLEKNFGLYKRGLAGHRSLALQTLFNELDVQTSKLAIAFPKLDKHTLLNKAKFLKGIKSTNTTRIASKLNPKKVSVKGSSTLKTSNSSSKAVSKQLANEVTSPKKVKLMWNNELSQTASTTTSSQVQLGIELVKDNDKKNEALIAPRDSEELRRSVAYALGASNLMGVILPSSSTHSKRGPSSWGQKNQSVSSLSTTGGSTNDVDDADDEVISVKEAVTILRRRKLPNRKPPVAQPPAPHERGLIGVEISNFEPQCTFFYRDRNGNYNPHLHHSKGVTESMSKQGKMGWYRTK